MTEWLKNFKQTFEMKVHHYVTVAGGTILVLLGLLSLRACQTKQEENIASTSLRANVQEKIVINPTKHTVTITTAKGTKTTRLPDRASSIEVFKTGGVKATIPQFGYEQRPFIGFGFSHVWKIVAGADLLYFKGLDLGPAVMFAPNNVFDSMRVAGVLSYTVTSNTRVGMSIDHLGTFGLFVTVRL